MLTESLLVEPEVVADTVLIDIAYDGAVSGVLECK